MGCVAHVRGRRCELWVATQNPNGVQVAVAEQLGVAPADVTVHVTLAGGGFGRRLNEDYAVEAAALARRLARPVQILWTREDDMRHGHLQAASVHALRATLDGGTVAAWRHQKVSTLHNLGGPPDPEELANPEELYRNASWGVCDVPYAFASVETAYVRVDAPVSIGPWRAVFSPSSVFARESFVDELARAAGQDPLAFRLAHLPEDTLRAAGYTIDRRRLRRVLELVAARSGWGTPPPAGVFRGLACNVYHGETHIATVAEVSLRDRPAPGKLPFVVRRVVCALDCGVIVNPLGIEQQVESGVAWGLSNMKGQITFEGGRVVEESYRDFAVLRMSEMPLVETHLVPSHGEQPFGVGEPTVCPVAPAVANALFAATGRRVRALPVTAV
jgi:isoquinoline 1-oxidoreductase beta subunit